MAIKEKFGLGYLTSDPAAAKDGDVSRARQSGGFAEQSTQSAVAMVAEKVLVALRARRAAIELSELVELTGYSFGDLVPALRVLEERRLITSQTGRFDLTKQGEQTHKL
jgi:hypothetical protein